MLVEASLVLPGLADHEHVRACGAAESVIGDASFVCEGFAGQRLCGLKGLFESIFSGRCLEKTIDPDHIENKLIGIFLNEFIVQEPLLEIG